MRRKSLLRQLESVKSIMRYRPPNGTAGLARSRVSGSSRVPLPPARTTANTFFMMDSANATRRDWRPAAMERFYSAKGGETRGGEDGSQGPGVRGRDQGP